MTNICTVWRFPLISTNASPQSTRASCPTSNSNGRYAARCFRALLADITVQITLAAAIPFRFQNLIDLVTRIALLAWQLIAFLEQFSDPCLIGSKHRRIARRLPLIPFRLGLFQRFADHLSAVTQFPADRANAHPLHVICLANLLIVVHRFHLLCTSGTHRTEVTLYGGYFFDNNSFDQVGPFYFTL